MKNDKNICIKVPVKRGDYIILQASENRSSNTLTQINYIDMYIYFVRANLSTICLLGMRSIGPSTSNLNNFIRHS